MSEFELKKLSHSEMKAVEEIQRSILGSLLLGKEIPQRHEPDPYQEQILASLQLNGLRWPLSLLWLPIDDDFISLTYKLLLKREPDKHGFLQFKLALARGVINRIEVLQVVLESDEFKKRGRAISGKRIVAVMDLVYKQFGKIPGLARFARFIWALLTCMQRIQRMEYQMYGMKSRLDATHLRTIDTVEYFHNQRSCEMRGTEPPSLASDTTLDKA